MEVAQPPWCGMCDPDTRLIAKNAEQTLLEKCDNCHDAPDKPLPQHARCPRCKRTIYKWDTRSPCDKHRPVGVHIQPFTKSA